MGEQEAGVWSLATLRFLNPTFALGARKTLEREDLPPLAPGCEATTVTSQLRAVLNEGVDDRRQTNTDDHALGTAKLKGGDRCHVAHYGIMGALVLEPCQTDLAAGAESLKPIVNLRIQNQSPSPPLTHPLSNTALPLRPDQTPTRRHFRQSFGRPMRDRWPVVSGPAIEAAFCWQLSSSCFMSRFHSPVRSSLRLWLLSWMPVWPGAPGIRDVCLALRKFWLGRGPTGALNQPTPKFSLEPPHRGCRRRSVAAWGRHWVCGGNCRLPRRLEPGAEPSLSRHAQGLCRRMM